MGDENKKVISVRLVNVILVIALIIGIIVGTRKYFSIKTNKMAKNNNEQGAVEVASINREEKVETTSRGEENARNEEESLEVQYVENEEIEENVNEDVETKAEETEEKSKYKAISEVTISKDMDLTVRTGLSREDFIELIAGVKEDTSGFFNENAGTIYDLCEEYSINEIFFCGLISAESGWNIAKNHRITHNYISLMSNGKLLSYSSAESGLREAARKLHTNYLTKGGSCYYGKTLTAVKTKFCPASSKWVSLVYGRMSQIIK